MLYLHHREPCTKVLGPGRRYVLWVQGCKRRCPGCINPEGQPLNRNGYWMSVAEVLQEIKAADGLRGITISGGEPFLQAVPLLALVRDLKATTNLDVMIYTGYTLGELRQGGDPAVQGLLACVDILIDGAYIQEQNHNSLYRGSDNQVIHILSPRYQRFRSYFEQTKSRNLEFVCREDGELFMIGLPPQDFEARFWQETSACQHPPKE